MAEGSTSTGTLVSVWSQFLPLNCTVKWSQWNLRCILLTTN